MKQDKRELYRSAVQFCKFGCVGVLNTIVDFVVYSIMVMLGLHYMWAQVIGYAFGVGNSYLLNSLWTFSRERRHTGVEFGRFLLVNLASLFCSLGVLWACHNLLHIKSDLWCKVIATPVALVVNFIGNKLFVFTRKPQDTAETAAETPARAEETAETPAAKKE